MRLIGSSRSQTKRTMHIKLFFVLAMLVTHAGPAAAQKMYKCGSTFSQTPCSPDAATKSLPSGAAAGGAKREEGYEL